MPLRTVCGLMPSSAASSLVEGTRSPSAYAPVKTSSSICSAICTNSGSVAPRIDVHDSSVLSLLVSYSSN